MSQRLPVTPAPEPLEAYAEHFDAQFSKRNQREGFRRYLEGLLLPAERNKTLTALGNSEPNVGVHSPRVQSLQCSSGSRPGTRIPSMSAGSNCCCKTR